jgi:hypothetical protein
MNRRIAVLAAAALAAAQSACGNGRAPAAAPAPPPAPPPPAAQETPPAVIDHLFVCVVEGGALRDVQIRWVKETEDTLLMDGRRFSDVHPVTPGSPYAGATPWYRQSAPVTFRGRRYTRYGQERALAASDLRPAGAVLGVPVFVAAEDSAAARPPVIYVPTRPGCEFQPYRAELMA